MQHFLKATLKTSEALEWLYLDPLRFTVFFECARRARRTTDFDYKLKLNQGEFVISETEFKKFGLRKTQKNKLARTIAILINRKFIEKTGSQTGNAHCNVYRLINEELFKPFYSNGQRNGERSGNGRGQKENRLDSEEREASASPLSRLKPSGAIAPTIPTPSLETFEDFFVKNGMTKKNALTFYAHHSAEGWRRSKNFTDLKQFTALATEWMSREFNRPEKPHHEAGMKRSDKLDVGSVAKEQKADALERAPLSLSKCLVDKIVRGLEKYSTAEDGFSSYKKDDRKKIILDKHEIVLVEKIKKKINEKSFFSGNDSDYRLDSDDENEVYLARALTPCYETLKVGKMVMSDGEWEFENNQFTLLDVRK